VAAVTRMPAAAAGCPVLNMPRGQRHQFEKVSCVIFALCRRLAIWTGLLPRSVLALITYVSRRSELRSDPGGSGEPWGPRVVNVFPGAQIALARGTRKWLNLMVWNGRYVDIRLGQPGRTPRA
jgi:hypothetical protein